MNDKGAARRAEVLLDRVLRIAVTATLVVVGIALGREARAQGASVLNLYSARHYQTDEALYENFTKQTAIKINRIELGDERLRQRLRGEGANSPADVVLLVDSLGKFKADELPIAAIGKSIVSAQKILDRVGYQ